MSIGSDPRIQAIIDSYRVGEYNPYYQQNTYEVTPGQFYNPIYDIRTEQIKEGKLEEGARFPKSDMEEKKQEEKKKEEPFDPCPPGYQLIDGVCQPNAMFQQGRGSRGGFTPPKISEEGLVEGFEQVIPPGLGPDSGAANSMAMLELEKKYGPDLAQQMGEMNQKYRYRGVQYNPETGQIAAMSPKNIGEWMGDIGGAVGSMFGGYTDSLMGGGLLGKGVDFLANLFKGKDVNSNLQDSTLGSGQMSEAEVAKLINALKSTGQIQMSEAEAARLMNAFDNMNQSDLNIAQSRIKEFMEDSKLKSAKTYLSKMTSDIPIRGTGSFGPPGRNYSTPAITRADQAANRLGTTLATRGR